MSGTSTSPQPVKFYVPASAAEPIEIDVAHSGLRMVLVNRGTLHPLADGDLVGGQHQLGEGEGELGGAGDHRLADIDDAVRQAMASATRWRSLVEVRRGQRVELLITERRYVQPFDKQRNRRREAELDSIATLP